MKNILVVDDSALMRRMLSDIINKDGKLHTDLAVTNGLEALEVFESGKRFDAVILDINMPKMNGLDLMKVLNKKGIKQNIIIVSTLAKEGAKETILALELGAFDFVTKPDSLAEVKGESFNKMLVKMIYLATGLNTGLTDENVVRQTSQISTTKKTHTAAAVSEKTSLESESGYDFIFRKPKQAVGTSKKLIALACSTGGPKALQYVIPFLPANLDAPIVLVQHMPEGFTASLSVRLNELSRINVKEAAEGDKLQSGTVYIAKGGSQMRVKALSSGYELSISAEPARNGLRPCADIMYESLMKSSFDEIICVVMTGMGADGTYGISQLKTTNKIHVIAQDEATCTVYGMPKAIAATGIVDQVVPLKKIAEAITEYVGVR